MQVGLTPHWASAEYGGAHTRRLPLVALQTRNANND